MVASVALWLTLAAAAATGLLAGASLDQSIKQLPARRRIGIEAYSAYSQASDLGNGIFFYGVLGVGAALLPSQPPSPPMSRHSQARPSSRPTSGRPSRCCTRW